MILSPGLRPPWCVFAESGQSVAVLPAGRPGQVADVRFVANSVVAHLVKRANQSPELAGEIAAELVSLNSFHGPSAASAGDGGGVMPAPVTLSLFTDDQDTVVASDMQDAAEVWAKDQGSTYEDAVGDTFDECWRRIGDDEVIRIHNDEGGETVVKRAEEWAASNGRGFLCSTDW